MRPVTMRDVAEHAGVSISSVSRVVRGEGPVSEDARLRVEQSIADLGYQANGAARSMRTGVSHVVGFVVPDISNPVFGQMYMGAERGLADEGYQLWLVNSGEARGGEDAAIRSLISRRVDGLLLSVRDETNVHICDLLGPLPSVLLDRLVEGFPGDSVLSDHRTGMIHTVTHLVRNGHRRIGFIAGSPKQYGSRVRHESFRDALKQFGLRSDPELEYVGELSEAFGEAGCYSLMSLSDPPTAIVIGSNQLTVGVLRALRSLSLRIPANVSIVSCDESPALELHVPSISVVRRDFAALGRTAAEMLLERISGNVEGSESGRRRRLLPTEFVARGSVGLSGRGDGE